MKHFTVLVLTAMAAVSGCATPVPAKPEADPVLLELARAASLAANSNRILAEVAVAQNKPIVQDQVIASLANEPTNLSLLASYQFDFVGPINVAAKAVAAKIGWRLEERGNPERVQIVQLSGPMTAVAALRSLSDQITWNLVADEKTQTIVLDYTRIAPLRRMEDQDRPSAAVADSHVTATKFYILAGTFGREFTTSTDRLLKKIRKTGAKATRVEDGQAQYVFVGPFASKAEAQAVINKGTVKGRLIEKGMVL